MSNALDFRQVQETLKEGAKISLSPEASVQCHFAVQLTLQTSTARDYTCWQIPTISYFIKYFPILWSEERQASLSEDAEVWLTEQESRLDVDWAHAKESCQLEADWRDVGKSSTSSREVLFLRSWLYVESRAYKDTREHDVLSSATLHPNDWQVLFPVIDHLSLDPGGCTVHIEGDFYWFEATREYKPDQPIGLLCRNSESDLLITCGATTQSLESREDPSVESLNHITNRGL
jgi:hypothetical protein